MVQLAALLGNSNGNTSVPTWSRYSLGFEGGKYVLRNEETGNAVRSAYVGVVWFDDHCDTATPKRLLVDALGSRLPREIVHRPKKGFTLPFEPWMRKQLRGFCENRLGASGLAGRGLFDLDRLATMWTSFQRGGSDVTWSRLWILVTLETWLARNKVKIPGT